MPTQQNKRYHGSRRWRVMEVMAGRATDVCVARHHSYDAAKRDSSRRNRQLLAQDRAEGREPRLDVVYFPSHDANKPAPWLASFGKETM